MTIRKLFTGERSTLSFEVFPPKKEAAPHIERMYEVLDKLSGLRPDYISVTYGAGGSDQMKQATVEIADGIQKRHGIPALAHLTCVGQTPSRMQEMIRQMQERGVENVLALRGDLPKDASFPAEGAAYTHAEDLIKEVRRCAPNMCIGAACYPEGHIECDDMNLGLYFLKRKQDAGADFFVTQLFFDNAIFYRFLEKARADDITLPISAGIMPILSRQQIERMIFMCGATLSSRVIKLLYKYQDDPVSLSAAGIDYAVDQAFDLAQNGVDGIHIYTMNRPQIAEHCAAAVRREVR